MTDCTVAAPARATKAPARSKAAPSPAPADEAPQQRQADLRPEWLSLGLMHTRRLCELLYALVDSGENDKAQGLIQELVETAEWHLYSISRQDSCVDVSADGALCGQISMVQKMLEGAWYAAEHGPLDYPPPLHEAVIPSAIAYAARLHEALQEVPRIDKLRELDSPIPTAGARPHRDRPTPPIRRVEDESTTADGPLDLHDEFLASVARGYDHDTTLSPHEVQKLHGRLQGIHTITAMLMADGDGVTLGGWLKGGMVDALFWLSNDAICDLVENSERAKQKAGAA